MNAIDAIIIAIVEGLTEFLPISSTGHMILTSACLGLENDEFLKTFEISIQLGAILAIASMYAGRFITNFEIYLKLAIAFIPTAIIGFLCYGMIKQYLFSPIVVSISLIVGGILLILLDNSIEKRTSVHTSLESVPLKNAFWIGALQGLSVIPGVSRAGASIIAGVFNGFDKKQATEFSFLLAVPTMMAATTYDLLKTPLIFSSYEFKLLALGIVGAFISAWITVKLFILFIGHFGFRVFGWYRILIGAVFLVLIQLGIID